MADYVRLGSSADVLALPIYRTEYYNNGLDWADSRNGVDREMCGGQAAWNAETDRWTCIMWLCSTRESKHIRLALRRVCRIHFSRQVSVFPIFQEAKLICRLITRSSRRMPKELWLFAMGGPTNPTHPVGNTAIDTKIALHWAFWMGDPRFRAGEEGGNAFLYHLTKDRGGNAWFEVKEFHPQHLYRLRHGRMFELTSDLDYENFKYMCQQIFQSMGVYNALNNNCQDFCVKVLDALQSHRWFTMDAPTLEPQFTKASDYFIARMAGDISAYYSAL